MRPILPSWRSRLEKSYVRLYDIFIYSYFYILRVFMCMLDTDIMYL